MNYKNIYNQLIEKRRQNTLSRKNGYCEQHHIIPKCFGGTNDKANLVNLTAREHYIAHALLFMHYKQINDKNKMIRMAYALHRLTTGNIEFKENIRFNSHLYEKIAKNRHISVEGKRRISAANKGRKASLETRQKLSAASKRYCKEHINGFYGKHHSDETKKKISRQGKLSAWYGRHHTDETKRKLSESRKNNPKCHGPHIGRKAGFHFSLETKIKQFHNTHDKHYPNIDWSQFDYKTYFDIVDDMPYKQKAKRHAFIEKYISAQNQKCVI